ncbi:MAG: flavin reductase family protein [Lachnospiraceae bacterium]|nr:flavin reductase family protein [Lachnospiraceae bacterium]
MGYLDFKPGNMLYPLPVVMVSTGSDSIRPNIITVAWAGTICSNPPMLSISVTKERFSHNIIRDTGEFVVNLVTEELIRACDYCGVKSGRDVDKFKEMNLTAAPSKEVKAPQIKESPVSIECKVREIKELGSHDMFIAEVVNVRVNDKYMDEKNVFNLNETGLVTYSHGTYFTLGKKVGTFGFSVRKDKK